MEPAPEIIAYYERFAEETRLASGPGRLEFERTKDILRRLLPSPPARIIDIGVTLTVTWPIAAKTVSMSFHLPPSRFRIYGSNDFGVWLIFSFGRSTPVRW